MGKKKDDIDKVRIEIVGTVGSTVTGSGTLLKFYDKDLNREVTICCDLGIKQDGSILENYRDNLETLDRINVKTLDFVLVSHLHGDHSFLVPALKRRGFKGQIIMTHESAQLAKPMWEDAMFINKTEIEWLQSKGHKAKQFYNEQDVCETFNNVYEYELNKDYQITSNIKLRLLDNSHVLGACSYQLWFTTVKGNVKSIVFTGDLGNIKVPTYFTNKNQVEYVTANAIICESTYGSPDRKAITKKMRQDEISKMEKGILNTLLEKQGNFILPCFSLQRSQSILKIVYDIFQRNKALQDYEVVLDGRLTALVTNTFTKCLQGEDKELLDEVLEWKNLKKIREFKATKAAISDEKPKVIITSQGFCDKGHSLAYCEAFVKKNKHTFCFVGYSPEGSNATKIKKKEQKYIKINGSNYELNCEVIELDSFSSHIQHNQLVNLLTLSNISDSVILIHGESSGKEGLKKVLEEKFQNYCKTTKVQIPKRGQVIKI